MAKKKVKQSPYSLKDQLKDYILDGIYEFEELSGLKVTYIEIKRKRQIGFGGGVRVTVEIETE